MVVQLNIFFCHMINYQNENFSLSFQENISDIIIVNILVAVLD